MKHLAILILLTSVFTTLVHAEETKTECPFMKEENQRHNPKQNLGNKLKVELQKPSNGGKQ